MGKNPSEILELINLLESYKKYPSEVSACFYLLKQSLKHANQKDSLAAYTYLRACLENILEIYYIYSKYGAFSQNGFSELIKAKKRGRAFTLKIINQFKGVPGPFKKKIAKTYIEVSTKLHPPFKLNSFDYISFNENFTKVVDIVAFLIIKIYKKSLCSEILQKIREKSLKYGLTLLSSKSLYYSS
ncbi:MAG: hypothetical protein DRN04_02390 [Thermoprotei archaeon]|nr:MAG: hypothetical protein DRN04_02390 [Thermoprotei archaeon]